MTQEDSERDRFDRHHFYRTYIIDPEKDADGEIFSVFNQHGNKYGTKDLEFQICQINSEYDFKEIFPFFGNNGLVRGKFAILAYAEGKTKALRLLEWWNQVPHTRPHAIACGERIKRRGVKTPPL